MAIPFAVTQVVVARLVIHANDLVQRDEVAFALPPRGLSAMVGLLERLGETRYVRLRLPNGQAIIAQSAARPG